MIGSRAAGIGALAALLAGAAGAQRVEPAVAVAPGADAEVEAGSGPSTYDPHALDACLAIRQGEVERAGCIGIAASLCVGETVNGTAEAVAGCYEIEATQWQTRLDAALATLADAAAASDAAEGGGAGTTRAAALETAQAAWAAWREAECEAVRRDAEGGGGEAAAAAECAMRLTGARALALDERVRRGEGP